MSAFFLLLLSTFSATDCNGNGVEDSLDLLPQGFAFLSAPTYPVLGSEPNSLSAVDLNSDGKPDLATATYRCLGCSPPIPGGISVLFNKGDGSFEDAVIYPVVDNIRSLVAADLNDDGKIDLATANDHCSGCSPPTVGGISVLINRGDGTFDDVLTLAAGEHLGPLMAADLNGDSKPDLAAPVYGCTDCDPPSRGGVLVIHNQGNGTFAESGKFAVGGSPHSLVAVDLDRDGTLDLASADSSNGILVLLNQGDGTLQDVVSYPLDYPQTLIAVDLSGDGTPDLAAADLGGVFLLLNRGNGTFDSVSYPVVNGSGGLIAADIDQDEQVDLAVWARSSGTGVAVLLNQGEGRFHHAGSHGFGFGSVTNLVVSADLNGDGMPDFAAAGSHINQSVTNVSVLLNRGDGNFDGTAIYSVQAAPRSLVAAELNGDGKPDLVYANEAGVLVRLNRGDGAFGDAVSYTFGEVIIAPQLIASDFNGDSRLDIALTRIHLAVDSGLLAVLLNHGDGRFKDSVSYPVGRYAESLIGGDLNNDGHLDLTTANSFSNNLSVLLGRGDGTFKDAGGSRWFGPPRLAAVRGLGPRDVLLSGAPKQPNPSHGHSSAHRGLVVTFPAWALHWPDPPWYAPRCRQPRPGSRERSSPTCAKRWSARSCSSPARARWGRQRWRSV
jgi:hypothetical protein